MHVLPPSTNLEFGAREESVAIEPKLPMITHLCLSPKLLQRQNMGTGQNLEPQ